MPRRRNGRIVSYATVSTTQKTDKKASQDRDIIKSSLLSAAVLFDLESNDIKVFEEQDFWDEHSLDAQRFYTTLCLVYGSDPKKYKTISKEADFSEDRAELCIDEYENISKNWLKLLNPYFKIKS